VLRGKVKKVFPGNNTSEGFYSFYDHIIRPDANRIYIIKGGPGVGKSTFMKKIGAAMMEKGFDVELHHCSSDNDSLDGVVIPALGIALIDGTAPHVVDPRYPGAVDEIINLGIYWDKSRLTESKEEVISLSKKIARLFKSAYSHLKEAKVVHNELESYYAETVDTAAVNKLIYKMCEEIFYGVRPCFDRLPYVRRLFASANTPGGMVNYIDTILQEARKVYLINGEPGTGAHRALQVILDEGVRMGLDCEAYHCPFEPAKLELLYFPSLSVGALGLNERLSFNPGALQGLDSVEILDLNQYLDKNVCSEYEEDITEMKKRIKTSFEGAWKKLNSAKAYHDLLEGYYVPAMDFTGVNIKRENILNTILAYAGKGV